MPDLSTGLIVYDFKFGLECYIRVKKKKKISRERPISQSEFNLKFYHVLNTLFLFLCNQNITFMYIYIYKGM